MFPYSNIETQKLVMEKVDYSRSSLRPRFIRALKLMLDFNLVRSPVGVNGTTYMLKVKHVSKALTLRGKRKKVCEGE